MASETRVPIGFVRQLLEECNRLGGLARDVGDADSRDSVRALEILGNHLRVTVRRATKGDPVLIRAPLSMMPYCTHFVSCRGVGRSPVRLSSGCCRGWA